MREGTGGKGHQGEGRGTRAEGHEKGDTRDEKEIVSSKTSVSGNTGPPSLADNAIVFEFPTRDTHLNPTTHIKNHSNHTAKQPKCYESNCSPSRREMYISYDELLLILLHQLMINCNDKATKLCHVLINSIRRVLQIT